MRSLLLILSFAALVAAALSAVMAKHAVSVRGQVMCGSVPAEGVKVRLFRVTQPKKDDLNQILAETTTGKPGVFLLEGNTNGFPLNETSMAPVVSFYHSCDEDASKVSKKGYRKFNYNIPIEYVAVGTKPKKTYDMGTLNLQLEFPGEIHDKKFTERKSTKA
ncbi:Transthyretin-like family protein [Teladorsagia circumcincta]|uniref:Transthyretin-like family protein n=1 Tax=Teladorsagia circumcincta TaxID=45464 RepID=A0A2G9UU57_TELCI|nr:Transthyretin-like family protein [Teladorsagia circumcincta]